MRRDPLATVVDLERSGAGGLVLSHALRPGHIRVKNAAGEVVAELALRLQRLETAKGQ